MDAPVRVKEDMGVSIDQTGDYSLAPEVDVMIFDPFIRCPCPQVDDVAGLLVDGDGDVRYELLLLRVEQIRAMDYRQGHGFSLAEFTCGAVG